jgi:hypothetical protein
MQVLDRGEKIELLVDKTENLRSQVFMHSFILLCSAPLSIVLFFPFRAVGVHFA